MTDPDNNGRSSYIGVRISKATKAWLTRYARLTHTTVSGIVSKLIEAFRNLEKGDQ
jgi:hypothetical protein